MVKTFEQMDAGSVDVFKQGQKQSNVLKRCQMQGTKSTRQFNSPTKANLTRAIEASLLKCQNEENLVDTAKSLSPHRRVKRNKTGPNHFAFLYRESNVCAKHVWYKDIGATTELKRPLTPMGLFEDECVFCHSFRTGQVYGPMKCYLNGRLVSIAEDNSSNATFVHKKCLEWAPKVWFKGDIVMDLESEIRRASRLRCRRCGLKGAALGCYYDECGKSFHVPCALLINGCHWENDGVLCPEHVSKRFLFDKRGTHTEENDDSSSLCQRQSSPKKILSSILKRKANNLISLKRHVPSYFQCTDKEGKFDDHDRENQQTDQLNTSNASSLPHSPYVDKDIIFDNRQRKNQQTEELDILNPSYLPQSQCSKKDGISTSGSRDGQQIDQLDNTSYSLPLGQHSDNDGIYKNHERDDQQTHKHKTSNFSSPQSCHPDEEGISNAYQRKEKAYQHHISSCPSDQLVLIALSLNASEKDFLQDFAYRTYATLTKEWAKNVTHVIVGKGAGSSWSRSFEVLMAVLLGKWVVHFEWIADCTLEMNPLPEASYEVACSTDSLRTIDGPKKGRMRATKGVPNLFSGLRFCLSAYMNPDNRNRVRDLIAAAEGHVLEGGDLELLLKNSDGSLMKPYFFVYDVDAPRELVALSTLREEEEEVRKHAAAGAQVICHLRVLDAVAAYDAEILNMKRDYSTP